ncbi:alpha/beta fold hydrolase [Allobranchiibius huperziae]|uniref:Acetyl esterase/lipase n=1 Tax=Allobranchiibius huperziae TaxID=1874116 RepID=A0A853DDE5_9MICO|nr:alpha/beta hydrolase [Allobranchiibius huperziae]NYJ75596.1 acetyl esterase/lipase [Allobranchiibius huperziae]
MNTILDVPYGKDERQRFDVHQPDTANGAAILLIHGGGWWQGDKSKERVAARVFAGAGYVVATPNYRLADAQTRTNLYPTQVDDVSRALTALKQSDVVFDRDRIAVVGGSSGGNLAVEIGIRHSLPVVSWSGLIVLDAFMQRHQATPAHRINVDPTANSASIDQSGADAAYYKWLVMNLVGSTDAAEVSAATASHRITSRCRPMFLVNSTEELVPATEVSVMACALARSNVAAQTLLLPGARHAEGYLEDAIIPTLAFLATHLFANIPVALEKSPAS